MTTSAKTNGPATDGKMVRPSAQEWVLKHGPLSDPRNGGQQLETNGRRVMKALSK